MLDDEPVLDLLLDQGVDVQPFNWDERRARLEIHDHEPTLL